VGPGSLEDDSNRHFHGTSAILVGCLVVATLNVVVRRESANVVEYLYPRVVPELRGAARGPEFPADGARQNQNPPREDRSGAQHGKYEHYKTTHTFDGTYQNPQWLG
jgi:hypothetical protein